ncbi:MAG TPA: DNA repair protein RecO C-terminal domain-containing protein, partial [Anaeromyxobacteraceae bacterium]
DLLDRKPAAPGSLRAYELGALRAAGLAPRLDDCARCGGRLPGSPARLAVGLDEGGFLCGSCGPPHRPGPRCGPAAAAALRRLAAVGPEGAGPLEEDVGAEAREMLTAFIEHQLGKRLPSRKFLDEVGPMLKP